MTAPSELHEKSLRCYYPNRRLRVLLQAILRKLGPDAAHARVLDVACGPGVLGDWLTQRGVQYMGVEIDEAHCAYAQARGLDVRHADVCALPDLGAFDVVVMSEALEHIEGPFELLAGLRKYLTPRGMLLLTVPSISAFRYLKHCAGLKGSRISADEHLVEFAPKPIMPKDEFWKSYGELSARIRECGYEIVWRKGVGALDFPKCLRVADWLFQSAGPRTLDALDWLCDLARGLIGCRYLCLGLVPTRPGSPR